MNWLLSFLLIFLVIGVLSKRLTPRENKILRANCGRFVPGFKSLSPTKKMSNEEFKSLYGREVKIGEAPWAVSLTIKKKTQDGELVEDQFSQHGSGTLVSPWHIVTAAHLIGISEKPRPDCATGDLRDATFMRDFKDFVAFINVTCAVPELCKGLRRREQFKPHAVQALYIRQGYVGDGCHDLESYNDIAVFELAEPVEFSESVFPACLPSSSKPPKMNSTGYKLYGYGTDPSDSKTITGKLKTIESKVMECSDVFSYGGIFCTGAKNKGLSCDGDSGSGVIRTSDTRNVEELVGVLSAGMPCDDVYSLHGAERRNRTRLTQETDLLIDVASHLTFFCKCCGICNKN